ncbi:MAG TPA: mycothiol system anti-sigma-R factor [Actinomycetales bacterium]|nr:mycothiol system anti-sigma-R factor [Actinomycetales bacterium]
MSEFKERAHCERRLEELYSYLDEEVTESEAQTIRAHLADCDPCSAERKLEEIVRALVRRSCESQAPAELRMRIVQRISVTKYYE